MINKRYKSISTIVFYTGKIITGIGLLMLIPMLTAVVYKEWNTAVDFLIGFSIAICLGNIAKLVCKNCERNISWFTGMIIVAVSWLACMFIAAIPYWLSGHWISYLDTIFDVMSGFTTTGLSLVQDLDHIPNGINMWRHILSYLGGQGLVVLALVFLSRFIPGAFTLYVGEAKDVKILPNVVNTAKAIWIISIVYLVIGTAMLFIAGLFIGIPSGRSLLHALWVYMAAWSTGGFAPQSQSILYYHSLLYETITIIFFILGSFNFALHYTMLTGNRKEMYKNIELISFYITSTILVIIATFEFTRAGVYPTLMSLFRRGYYQIISAHTTTGFMTIYARQFIHEWGGLAMIAIIIAMLIGGSASSTAGGFKGLRLGITMKSLFLDIKKLMLPDTAVISERFHFMKQQVLSNEFAKSSMLVILLYIFMFALGSIAAVLSGYPLLDAVFESASVTGNVGLSCGVTSASMPAGLKITYMLMMWVARLEFMSVLVLIGSVIKGVSKLCKKSL